MYFLIDLGDSLDEILRDFMQKVLKDEGQKVREFVQNDNCEQFPTQICTMVWYCEQ